MQLALEWRSRNSIRGIALAAGVSGAAIVGAEGGLGGGVLGALGGLSIARVARAIGMDWILNRIGKDETARDTI